MGAEEGLAEGSVVNALDLVTLSTEALSGYRGELGRVQVARLDAALALALGLEDARSERLGRASPFPAGAGPSWILRPRCPEPYGPAAAKMGAHGARLRAERYVSSCQFSSPEPAAPPGMSAPRGMEALDVHLNGANVRR